MTAPRPDGALGMTNCFSVPAPLKPRPPAPFAWGWDNLPGPTP